LSIFDSSNSIPIGKSIIREKPLTRLAVFSFCGQRKSLNDDARRLPRLHAMDYDWRGDDCWGDCHLYCPDDRHRDDYWSPLPGFLRLASPPPAARSCPGD